MPSQEPHGDPPIAELKASITMSAEFGITYRFNSADQIDQAISILQTAKKQGMTGYLTIGKRLHDEK